MVTTPSRAPGVGPEEDGPGGQYRLRDHREHKLGADRNHSEQSRTVDMW